MPQGAAETTWLDDSRKAAAAPEPFYGRDAAASTSATLLARLSGAVMTSVIRGRKSSDRGSSFRISVTVTPCTLMLASACFTASSLNVRMVPSIFMCLRRYGTLLYAPGLQNCGLTGAAIELRRMVLPRQRELV